MPSDADDAPEIPIICPECDTTATVRLSELEDRLARHNERLHDGEDVATVDPELKARLTDLVAEDLGLLDDTG